jgi:hypothetical protein
MGAVGEQVELHLDSAFICASADPLWTLYSCRSTLTRALGDLLNASLPDLVLAGSLETIRTSLKVMYLAINVAFSCSKVKKRFCYRDRLSLWVAQQLPP